MVYFNKEINNNTELSFITITLDKKDDTAAVVAVYKESSHPQIEFFADLERLHTNYVLCKKRVQIFTGALIYIFLV